MIGEALIALVLIGCAIAAFLWISAALIVCAFIYIIERWS